MPAIHITCKVTKPLVVPVNYQHLLQAFVYSILPDDVAQFLHDQGYVLGEKQFKAFTFSQLRGNPRFNRRFKTLEFQDEFSFSISSVLPEVIEKSAEQLLLQDDLSLHGTKLEIASLEFDELSVDSKRIVVEALSPITIHETFTSRTGRKITHYFTPFDQVFGVLLEQNFAGKYQAVTGKELPDASVLDVKRKRVSERDKIVSKYKN